MGEMRSDKDIVQAGGQGSPSENFKKGENPDLPGGRFRARIRLKMSGRDCEPHEIKVFGEIKAGMSPEKAVNSTNWGHFRLQASPTLPENSPTPVFPDPPFEGFLETPSITGTIISPPA